MCWPDFDNVGITGAFHKKAEEKHKDEEHGRCCIEPCRVGGTNVVSLQDCLDDETSRAKIAADYYMWSVGEC